MPVLPLLQNYKNEAMEFRHPSQIDRDAGPLGKKLITALLKVIDKYKFGGITIDIEEVPEGRRLDLFKFMKSSTPSFNPGLILAQAVPFDNPDWNYKAYASVTDYLMLMAYDQHWSTGEAGPIADRTGLNRS